MHKQWSKEIPKAINYRLQGTIGLDWSPLVNATTFLCCSHPGEIFNDSRSIYDRVERDGWDELLMPSLVWIHKSSMDWVRVCRKGCLRLCMSGVCEQGGAGLCRAGEVMDVMERGWTWYNKIGWAGFIITIKVSYEMRVVEECHSMEWMKLTERGPQQVG